MELIVKNFGPIKNAHVHTKRYNVLIGNTSTGKSVLAKLISIAYDYEFLTIKAGDFVSFYNRLKQYSIDYSFSGDTSIIIKWLGMTWSIKKDVFSIENPFYEPFFSQGVTISNYQDYVKDFYNHVLDKNKHLDKNNIDDVLRLAIEKAQKDFFEQIGNGQLPKLEETTQFQKDYFFYNFLASVYSLYASIYIPAERNLMSIFTNNIFSLLKSNYNIPESIKRFGSWFEMAKGENKQMSIDFVDVKIDFSDENHPITIADEETKIRFEQASSGLQSLIPLWSVFLHGIHKFSHGTAIIEEPELNLFPTLQVSLLNNMIAAINQTKANLLITTHSPYILSVLDNLIYANDVYQKAKTSDKTDLVQRLEKVVNPMMMIDYNDVAAYHCKDNGDVILMNDDQMRNTGAYALDEASSFNSKLFNELIDIDNEL